MTSHGEIPTKPKRGSISTQAYAECNEASKTYMARYTFDAPNDTALVSATQPITHRACRLIERRLNQSTHIASGKLESLWCHGTERVADVLQAFETVDKVRMEKNELIAKHREKLNLNAAGSLATQGPICPEHTPQNPGPSWNSSMWETSYAFSNFDETPEKIGTVEFDFLSNPAQGSDNTATDHLIVYARSLYNQSDDPASLKVLRKSIDGLTETAQNDPEGLVAAYLAGHLISLVDREDPPQHLTDINGKSTTVDV